MVCERYWENRRFTSEAFWQLHSATDGCDGEVVKFSSSKFLRPGNSLDVIVSNVYQKLILRFGQPETIKVNGKKPRVVFFVPTLRDSSTASLVRMATPGMSAP